MKRQHVDPNRQINFFATVTEKACTQCKQVKPASAFGPRLKAKDGLRDWCNECGTLYQQKYYRSNLEECRRRKREWMAKQRQDPQKRREMNERSRNSYHLRRDRTRQALRERWRTRFFWSRAQKVGSVRLAPQLARLWHSQRGCCALTGVRLNRENAHLDHIIPKAKGGTNGIGNLRWTCKEVNIAKRDMTDEEFLAMCESVIRWIGERMREQAA